MMADLLTLFTVKHVLRNGAPMVMLEDTSKNPPVRMFLSKKDAIWVGKQMVKEAKKLK